jgi:quinol monooxygenase YgiN
MGYAIARVKITELDEFLETFAGRGLEKRREHGCRGVLVHQSVDDPTEMINVFDWDREGVEAFMGDPDVPEIMQAAGLQKRPEFTYVERVAELEA